MLALLAALASCAGARGGPERPDVLLATTTSFQDSGLLDVLAADFAARSGYRLRPTAVGSGAAIAIAARGDVDVVFAHSPDAEQRFMAEGHGRRRLLVMHNDFVVLGPPHDPAGVRGTGAHDAFRRIASAGAAFISRGDDSGTHVKELALWREAGIDPRAEPWYVVASTGMGQTLQVASERDAYTLGDRGTFLARRESVTLEILVENDPPLLNHYHVMTVDPARHPGVNAAGADAFADYLVSRETQRLIAEFGVDRFGERLFFPDAEGSP